MRSFPTYLVVIALAMCVAAATAQHRVRISGLDSNPEYRALVAQEESLSRMSDSISRSMDNIRRAFRTDTGNRSALTASILRMEEEMFDIRNRQARVTGQINAIEQEWILRSLDSDPAAGIATDSLSARAEERQVANLVYNSYFDLNLRPEDCRDLRGAQEKEAALPEMIAQYSDNHGRLRILRHAYNLSIMADTADSIKTRFDSLSLVNRELDRRISSDWGAVFDNKSYAYNFLMDKNNRSDLLQRYEDDLGRVRAELAEVRGTYMSDAIAAYALQKQLITDYEIMLAQELGNDGAADSLATARAAIPRIDALGIEPVVLRERLFLDYSDITLHTAPQYSSRNPIPEVEVYPKGVIYRVLLGTYSSAQQPSVFRNVAPIAVRKGPDNKYRYFAGGFPSDSTVNAAVEQMRSRGFKKPEPVVWMDGVYVNLATGQGIEKHFYRIELSGVHELTAEVREIIRTVTGGKDIVRAGDLFVVSPLDNAAEAVRLRTALERRDPEMDVKISAIE